MVKHRHIFFFNAFFLFLPISYAQNDFCTQIQDEAAKLWGEGNRVAAIATLESKEKRCDTLAFLERLTEYREDDGNYDEALLSLQKVLGKSSKMQKKRFLRWYKRIKQRAIKKNREQLQKRREVPMNSVLEGERSARGGFELKGPALKQRLKIEHAPCPQQGEKLAFKKRNPSKPLDKRILFDYASASIRGDMRVLLETLAETFKPLLRSGSCVLIVGHTDRHGSHKTNLQLSRMRADSVRRALIRLGMNKKYLQSAGMGKLQLRDTETDKDADQRNRRVEFTLFSP